MITVPLILVIGLGAAVAFKNVWVAIVTLTLATFFQEAVLNYLIERFDLRKGL